MESKYHIIKYSARHKNDRVIQHWNDVTDDPLGEYWSRVLEDFKGSEYYTDPTLDNAIRITEDDFNILFEIIG